MQTIPTASGTCIIHGAGWKVASTYRLPGCDPWLFAETRFPGSQRRSWLILQTFPSTTGRSLLFLSECWASKSRIRKLGSSQKPPTALRIVGKGNLQRGRCDDFEQITSQNMMIVPGGNKNCLGWFKVCKPSLILRSAQWGCYSSPRLM